MKIIYIGEFPIPTPYANSVQVMKMCGAFAGLGHQVKLIVPKGTGGDNDQDTRSLCDRYAVASPFEVERVSLPEGRLGVYAYARNAVKAAVADSPDLIYTRSIRAASVAVWRGWPTSFESHMPVEGRIAPLLLRVASRRGSFQHLVCISERLATYYRDSGQVPLEKIQVAHDGADPCADSEIANRLPNQRCMVGFVGQLFEGHGIGMIVELAVKFPDVEFHVLGGTGGVLEHWRSRVDSSNLHFHGHVDQQELRKWYHRFDLLIAPYHRHIEIGGGGDKAKWMSPLKIFEYMAAGKAILCSDLPVLREVLEHERTALLVPPEDVGAWERAMRRLIDEPELRMRLGKAARQELEAKYTWEMRARKVLGKNAEILKC